VPEAVIEFPFDAVRAVVSLLYSGTLSRCSDLRFIFPHAGNAVPTLKARICRVVGNDKVLAKSSPKRAAGGITKAVLRYRAVGETGNAGAADGARVDQKRPIWQRLSIR